MTFIDYTGYRFAVGEEERCRGFALAYKPGKFLLIITLMNILSDILLFLPDIID